MTEPQPRYTLGGEEMYMFGGWDFVDYDHAEHWLVNRNSWSNMGEKMLSYFGEIKEEELSDHLSYFLGDHLSSGFNRERVRSVMPVVNAFDFSERPAALCILMSLMGQSWDYDRKYLMAWYGNFPRALTFLVKGVEPENVAAAIENDVDVALISSL